MKPTAIPVRTRTLAAGIASLLSIALMAVGPTSVAFASASLTVKVTHGGKYTAKASGVMLTDNGVSTLCQTRRSTPASTLKGTLSNGTHTGPSPVKLGTVSAWAFHACVSPLGGAVTMRVRSLPYGVKADPTTNGTGDTDLIISGINIRATQIGCAR